MIVQYHWNEWCVEKDDIRVLSSNSGSASKEEKFGSNVLYKKEENGIQTFILSITPVTIHLLVNVSAPSTVWCSAVEMDGVFNELTLMNQKGQSILGNIESEL